MPAIWLGMLDADFDVGDSPELAGHLHRLAARYERAAGAARVTTSPAGATSPPVSRPEPW
jgi:hypothetical protein